jgi:hypothetical protein
LNNNDLSDPQTDGLSDLSSKLKYLDAQFELNNLKKELEDDYLGCQDALVIDYTRKQIREKELNLSIYDIAELNSHIKHIYEEVKDMLDSLAASEEDNNNIKSVFEDPETGMKIFKYDFSKLDSISRHLGDIDDESIEIEWLDDEDEDDE